MANKTVKVFLDGISFLVDASEGAPDLRPRASDLFDAHEMDQDVVRALGEEEQESSGRAAVRQLISDYRTRTITFNKEV